MKKKLNLAKNIQTLTTFFFLLIVTTCSEVATRDET